MKSLPIFFAALLIGFYCITLGYLPYQLPDCNCPLANIIGILFPSNDNVFKQEKELANPPG